MRILCLQTVKHQERMESSCLTMKALCCQTTSDWPSCLTIFITSHTNRVNPMRRKGRNCCKTSAKMKAVMQRVVWSQKECRKENCSKISLQYLFCHVMRLHLLSLICLQE